MKKMTEQPTQRIPADLTIHGFFNEKSLEKNHQKKGDPRDVLSKLQEAINTLSKTLRDPQFESAFPGFTKKEVIDLVFEKSERLNTMSSTPKEELKEKFYQGFVNKPK